MACFLVPAAEAVVGTVVEKVVESKEEKTTEESSVELNQEAKIPFSRKIKWLTYMLWGGAILLMFEHVWHGEVVPFFPFLTAMSDPSDASEMFHEMATTGVTMAVLVTVVWIGMCVVSNVIMKRSAGSKSVA